MREEAGGSVDHIEDCGPTLTIVEAALILRIHSKTAYRLAQSGFLAGVPVIRVGGSIRIPKERLEAAARGLK